MGWGVDSDRCVTVVRVSHCCIRILGTNLGLQWFNLGPGPRHRQRSSLSALSRCSGSFCGAWSAECVCSAAFLCSKIDAEAEFGVRAGAAGSWGRYTAVGAAYLGN